MAKKEAEREEIVETDVKKESDSKFFKAYFTIAIAYAIIGLVDSIFILTKTSLIRADPLYQLIMGFIASSVFILAIIALVTFIKNKFSKITLVVPIIHLVLPPFMFIYGFISGFVYASQNLPSSEYTAPFFLIILGIASSAFEFLFSIYVLRKLR